VRVSPELVVARHPQHARESIGRHHTRLDSQIDGVSCIRLNKVRMPGNLVAIEFPDSGREWTVLGEWPEPRP
jgi:hypothetical protein